MLQQNSQRGTFILKSIKNSKIHKIKHKDILFRSNEIILYNKKEVGFIGELDKDYIQEFSIDQDIHILNLDLDKIRLKTFNNKFEELSKFPSSRRDLSMILDNNIKFEEIESIAYGLEGKILKDVVLFDEFKGKNIGDDKKSFAVSFTFNDSKKTLTDKIIDKIMTRFADAYKLELGAVIRDK